jgi:hypothetical protein
MSHYERRFPPPWSAEEHQESYSVRDATSFPICWLYFARREADIDPLHGNRMTKDQARRIAANIAKLPGLLGAERGRT